ncbi:MAG: hypothetical protein ACKVUS_12925 [Saprospiraceae bacterium]
MSTIVLSSNRPEDIRQLADLATQLGIQFFTIPKLTRQMKARQQLTEWAFRNAPKEEVPAHLIDQLVEQTRSERYAQKKSQGNR